MKNYQELHGPHLPWLKPGGQLFVHIFTHRDRRLPLRGPKAPTTGCRATSSPAGKCRPTISSSISRTTSGSASTGGSTAGTTSKRREAWLHNMDAPPGARSCPLFAETYGEEEAHQVVELLARVLHGLRRALGIPGRRGMACLPLPFRESHGSLR